MKTKKISGIKICIGFIISVCSIISCNKDKLEIHNSGNNNNYDTIHYHNIYEFFHQNEVKAEFFAFDVASGGNFTSAKGTHINVSPNSFVYTDTNALVSGQVTVEFKDIYSKSDMILSGKPTNMAYGHVILKSAGMFFIRVKQSIKTLNLASGKSIKVEQPLNGLAPEGDMKAFVLVQDSIGMGWGQTNVNTLTFSSLNYLYTMYSFSSPIDSGTWCNSDNSSYFSGYPQTTLTVHQTDDPSLYNTNVFLVFPGVNAMVHVYQSDVTNFTYYYSPQGLNCSIVALGVKNEKLYYFIKNTIITPGITIDATLSEITNDSLIYKLHQLNN